MWELEPSTQWQKDQKWYEKKRPDELAATLRNLQRLVGLLNSSKSSKLVEGGYLHKEPGGVIAVDQKGFAANLQETRLYVYCVDETKTIHVITIGSKDDQHSDIEYCKDFVVRLNTLKKDNP